jgi:hypothetical protein
MKFLKSWSIALDKLPTYAVFKKHFTVQLDNALLRKMYKSRLPVFTDERKALLLPIINALKGDTLIVKHNQRFNLGRFYADNSISPICLARHIKHTLFQHLGWFDLDMVKGHPTILYNIAKNNGLELKYFKKYLDNPSYIFEELIKHYSTETGGITEDNVKDIFNIAIYGGSHNTWLKQMEADDKQLATNNPHPFVVCFIQECKNLIDIIYLNNPSIAEKVKGNETNEYHIKTRVMSYWCGCIENHIIFTCFNFLKKRDLIDNGNIVLEYDGLCLKLTNTDDEFMDSILVEMNELILKETGLEVKMKWKGYKKEHIHLEALDEEDEEEEEEDIYNEEDCSEENAEVVINRTYEVVKKEFEEKVCKIIQKSIFVENMDNQIIFYKKEGLKTSYEHLKYEEVVEVKGVPVIKSQPFLSRWFDDEKINTKDKLGVYPHDLKCPSNVYNMWRPFDMELVTDYTEKSEAISFIRNHIKILCGNDENIADYFEKWLAQMIQYPSVKTIMPTFISKEGAGKGTLLKIMRKMIGDSKVVESTQPSLNVWGTFNGMMANTFVINLNELSKKETMECEGFIKGLITDDILTINEKGKSQYDIKSYHRFIATTNNEEPLSTGNDDRRNLIIKCSDELCGNKEYFDKFYELIEDINSIKSYYEYLKKIPEMNMFGKIPLPVTEYHAELKTMSEKAIERWIKDFTQENYNKVDVRLTALSVYDNFCDWITKNGSNYTCSNMQFGVRLTRLKVKGVEKKHTSKGCVYTFNIKEMECSLGLGCLITA